MRNTATLVPIANRRLLWKWLFALASFELAERSIDAVLDKPLTEKDLLYAPLTSAALVFYARPFTSSRSAGRLQDSIVPERHRKLHRFVMLARNKIVAHSDADHFLHDVNLPLNQAIYHVNDKGGRFRNTNNTIKSEYLFELVTLMDRLSDLGKEYVNGFRLKYAEEFPIDNGSYLLHIKATPGPLWQRYRPLGPEP
jgi:hypothetical protein